MYSGYCKLQCTQDTANYNVLVYSYFWLNVSSSREFASTLWDTNSKKKDCKFSK